MTGPLVRRVTLLLRQRPAPVAGHDEQAARAALGYGPLSRRNIQVAPAAVPLNQANPRALQAMGAGSDQADRDGDFTG